MPKPNKAVLQPKLNRVVLEPKPTRVVLAAKPNHSDVMSHAQGNKVCL